MSAFIFVIVGDRKCIIHGEIRNKSQFKTFWDKTQMIKRLFDEILLFVELSHLDVQKNIYIADFCELEWQVIHST